MQDMAAMETTSLPVHEANLELMVNDGAVEHAEQFIPLPSHVREKFYAPWKSSVIVKVRLPSTLTHLPLQTFLPVTMMDHLPYLPHSLDFDLPPSSPFHHPQNSSSNTLNPDAQPFYSLALVDYLTFHMSLIHPPNSPQPIQILQVALHPTTPIQ
nr:hypothetical protein CFP56_45910 [Quercus suber]